MTTRLAIDASTVQGTTGVRLGTMLQVMSAVVAGIVIGFIYSWQLTLGLLAFAPILLLAGVMEMKMWTGQDTLDKELYENAGKVGQF